ncbi:unnamed protein product [Amoebophrya sp. A120]|nr:unnamed protein product [Amoebophrya sp. A120]|eukprot:GSA120T00000102001.1
MAAAALSSSLMRISGRRFAPAVSRSGASSRTQEIIAPWSNAANRSFSTIGGLSSCTRSSQALGGLQNNGSKNRLPARTAVSRQKRSFSQAAMSAAAPNPGEEQMATATAGEATKEGALPPSPSGSQAGAAAEGGTTSADTSAATSGTDNNAQLISDLETQNEELKEKNDDLLSKLRYQMADAENIRKRQVLEVQQAKDYAISKFAKDIVEVADNLQRALETVPEQGDAGSATASTTDGGSTPTSAEESLKKLYEGVKLTDDILLKTLEKYGIAKLNPMNEKFDPNFHEAMFQLDSEQPKDTVVHVMQNGWKLKDRMLRAARVGTSKGPPAA